MQTGCLAKIMTEKLANRVCIAVMKLNFLIDFIWQIRAKLKHE